MGFGLINLLRTVHARSQQTYGSAAATPTSASARAYGSGTSGCGGCSASLACKACTAAAGATTPPEAVWEDRAERTFCADRPDTLLFTDITQHRTREGWVYAPPLLDVYSRSIVGWSIADHLRTELVVDAVEMARWRRRPTGTIVYSDRGAQYTSWLFGRRFREAGLLGSMGKAACAHDSPVMESFFGSMQIELLDRRTWATRADLANATFEWIEAFYNPNRRHSALGCLSPNDYETLHSPAATAA